MRYITSTGTTTQGASLPWQLGNCIVLVFHRMLGAPCDVVYNPYVEQVTGLYNSNEVPVLMQQLQHARYSTRRVLVISTWHHQQT